MNRIYPTLPLALCIATIPAQHRAESPERFPVLAIVDAFGPKVPLQKYIDANFNSVLVNFEGQGRYQSDYLPTLRLLQRHEFPYHLTPPTPNNGAILKALERLRHELNGFYGNIGFYAADEPDRLRMDDVRDLIHELRRHSDVMLADWAERQTWVTAMEKTSDSALLWCNRRCNAPSYRYEQYLEHLANEPSVDRLAYDMYPFMADGSTRNFYENMMLVRAAARRAKKPHWVWLQATDMPDPSRNNRPRGRLPSESDLRVQALAHLAVGYRGFAYFRYHSSYVWNGKRQPSYIWDPHRGVAGSGYHHVAKLNRELRNLGLVMQHLHHVDSWIVRGPQAAWPVSRKIPQIARTRDGRVLNPQLRGLGIDRIRIIGRTTGTTAEENLMLSLFCRPGEAISDRNAFFVVTSLDHGANRSAANARVEFEVDFHGKISRANGDQRWIYELLQHDSRDAKTKHLRLRSLGDNHYRLRMQLEASCALLKFDNGDFPRDVVADARTIGIGCGTSRSTGHPRLRSSRPVIGRRADLTVESLGPNNYGIALFGAVRHPPQNMGYGCRLHVDLPSVFASWFLFANNEGIASFRISLPADAALVGFRPALQALVANPDAPLGLLASTPLEWRLGSK